jgi:hypothetical protein
MREELEVKLLESQEYIEKLEQRASGEGDRQVTEITNSWIAGRKSGLEEGADTAKVELLPQLEQLKQQVSGLENTLRNEEEQHDTEVAVMRREAYFHGREEIGHIFWQNQQMRGWRPLMRRHIHACA